MSRFTKKEDVDIYEMKLHDYVEINEGPLTYIIHRVHCGWIYVYDFRGYETSPTVFVPETKRIIS